MNKERKLKMIETMKKYIPVICSDAALRAVCAVFGGTDEAEATYSALERKYAKWKYKCRSNNWLKMHGVPMRRGKCNRRRIAR